jgi:glycine/D-amino acid oxidase-like deaminating enzyme
MVASMASAPSVERVFWWATSKPFTPAAAEFPSGIDVAVVGGGYTGIAAARELASRGASVVLERRTLGIGASTRNAGMTIAALKDSLAVLMKRHGEETGRQLFETSLAANRFVEELMSSSGPIATIVGMVTFWRPGGIAISMRWSARQNFSTLSSATKPAWCLLATWPTS